MGDLEQAAGALAGARPERSWTNAGGRDGSSERLCSRRLTLGLT